MVFRSWPCVGTEIGLDKNHTQPQTMPLPHHGGSIPGWTTPVSGPLCSKHRHYAASWGRLLIALWGWMRECIQFQPCKIKHRHGSAQSCYLWSEITVKFFLWVLFSLYISPHLKKNWIKNKSTPEMITIPRVRHLCDFWGCQGQKIHGACLVEQVAIAGPEDSFGWLFLSIMIDSLLQLQWWEKHLPSSISAKATGTYRHLYILNYSS